MTKNLNSQFKANSFCCTLNNIDKLFDHNDKTFEDSKYSDKTRQLVTEFRNNLDPNKTYSAQEMVEHLIYLWIEGKEDTRSAAANYEIGENGVHHSHLILEAKNQARFSAIQKLYPTIHVSLTRGNREEVIAYLNKTGKHEEKSHTTVVPMMNHGIIEANQQGKRSDLETIQELLESGLTPEQVMRQNLSYRRYSKMIKEHYYQLKIAEVPLTKDIVVYWHLGEAGSGKSYMQVNLKQEYGTENIYVLSDYANGGLDNYAAEPILFLDEFKGDISYPTFLQLLDIYPNQVHARYSNVYALWTEVHISSIFTPDDIYHLLVPEIKQKIDPIQQLYRRIHTVIYHAKTSDNKYKTLKMTMTDYLELVRRKLDFETLIKDYITKDDTTSDYTYDPNKKATSDISTDQSETHSDS